MNLNCTETINIMTLNSAMLDIQYTFGVYGFNNQFQLVEDKCTGLCLQ